MEGKFNFNKLVYTIIAVLLVIIIIVAVSIAVKNGSEVVSNDSNDNEEVSVTEDSGVTNGILQGQEAEISEIEEGDLPTDEELAEYGLENVMQTSKINQQFNLYNYEITEDGGIKYNYLANAVTSGERLSVTAKAMTEDEYNDMLPDEKAQNNTVDGIDVVYNDRSLYHTVDETQVPEYVKNAEEAGNVVVRYGNSLGELLPMQQLMWYKDGIGYTLESISRNYTYDDMAALAHDFFEATK